MREILFKAVSTEGKWVEGLFCKCKQIWSNLFTPCIQVLKEWDSGDYLDHIEVLPETVCFASSRVDENKGRIFHGDIVNFTIFDHTDSDTQHTGIVQWTGDKFIIVYSMSNPYFSDDGPYDLDWVCDQDDTIKLTGGNIHDSKLKG